MRTTHTAPARIDRSYRLTQYNGTPAPLYIQCKGLHSGRPLTEPIPNCFALHTDHPHAFALAFAAYTAKKYRYRIGGSVVPFITLERTREVLDDYLKPTPAGHVAILEQVDAINALLVNLEKRSALLKQYRHALCASL